MKTLILLLVIPLLFVGFWSAVCCLIAAVGGWMKLACSFAATEDDPSWGVRLSGLSGHTNPLARYSGILNPTISREGIRLAVMVLFRAGHRPLFIPWQAVRNIRHVSRFFQRGIAFDVVLQDTEKTMTIHVYGKGIGEHVERALQAPPE